MANRSAGTPDDSSNNRHNDHALLERLNALKSTSVTLDRSSNALDGSSTGIEPAAPPSREDALAARLKTLRNRSQGTASPAATPSAGAAAPAVPGRLSSSADPPPPYTEGESAAQPLLRRQKPDDNKVSAPGTSSDSASPHEAGGGDELDELLGAGGSQSLDELLEGLNVDDEQWLPGGGDEHDGGPDESARVAELLAKLQDDPPFQIIKGEGQQWQTSKDEEDAADDSEGEAMKREIDDVIAKALDEVELDGSMPPEEKPDEESDSGAGKALRRSADLSLPSAPTKLRDESGDDISTDEETSTDEDSTDDDSSDGNSPDRASSRKRKRKKKKKPKLKLPDAPVRIWDPAASKEKNFDTDIARRMAFLKRLDGRLQGTLEMPSAPTFKPEDKPGKGAS